MSSDLVAHRRISAGGASFHCAIVDEGEHTVLFLHPFPLNWQYWEEQLTTVAAAGYRTVALDLRGYGQSDNQPGPVHLRRLVTDVTSVLRALGAGSATVVGSGMGGSIAWALAHQAPAALKSVVVMGASHPLVHSKMQVPRRLARWIRIPSVRRRHLVDGSLVRGCLAHLAAPENRTALLQSAPVYAKPLSRKTAADAASETYEATRTLGIKEKRILRDKVGIPVWSVRGELDPAVSPTAFAADAKFAGQVVHTEIPHAGHYVAQETPSAVTAVILRHLASLKTGA